MVVVDQFSTRKVNNCHWLNPKIIALILNKEGTEDVSEFRNIILIHTISILISKMTATRLTFRMNELVANAQKVFIKKISIHDNYCYVQNLPRFRNFSQKPYAEFEAYETPDF